jgi:hypothetical protein
MAKFIENMRAQSSQLSDVPPDQTPAILGELQALIEKYNTTPGKENE